MPWPLYPWGKGPRGGWVDLEPVWTQWQREKFPSLSLPAVEP